MFQVRASRLAKWLLGSVVVAVASTSAQAGLVFNFIPAAGTSQQAIDGFTAAGAMWSNIFDDNITINMNIGFTALGAGILAQAGSSQGTISYAGARAALIADKTSADDITATNSLQAGPNLRMLINGTSNNPNGPNSGIPYLDTTGANTSTIRMNTANAKALGLLAGNNPAVDASITFSTSFSWDFDRSNGITGSAFDFVGIAAHEIGHAMGFISGVDVLDGNRNIPDNAFTYVSPLDLFRYSNASRAVNAIDWTAGNSTKFFSLDGGATNAGATFSTGVVNGDGNQASHWKDNLGIGIMDPTAGNGELLTISAVDIRAFDVIGYNLKPLSVVPEPATLVSASLAGVFGLGMVARSRRKQIAA